MWKTTEYTAAGRRHLRDGIPCQDKVCTYRNGNVTVITLADGAGCAKMSHFGAEAVTRCISRELGEHFERYFEESDALIVRQRFCSKMLEALKKTQAKLHCDLRDLSSTLLAVAVSGTRHFIVHIGDGVIGYLKDDEIKTATYPHNGDFANETFFTTDNSVISHMRIIKGDDEKIHGFVLMSDGTGNVLFDKKTGKLSRGIRRIMQMSVMCPEHSMQSLLSDTFDSLVLKLTQDDCSISVLADTSAFPSFGDMSVPEKLELLQLESNARYKSKRIWQTGEILRIASGGACAAQIARKTHINPKHINKKLEFLLSLGLIEADHGRYYSESVVKCASA